MAAGRPNKESPHEDDLSGRRGGNDLARSEFDDRRLHGGGNPEPIIDELVRQEKRDLIVIANDTAFPGRRTAIAALCPSGPEAIFLQALVRVATRRKQVPEVTARPGRPGQAMIDAQRLNR